ncbi:MAG TPA: CPBP family glutamic-type intramembrane protease [Candidatus Deferrimicrobium sp.]|nr:CPBP family glutamic-type intramembrane protease [Candidatus Deferrimicrobium sp.]
MNNLRQQLNKRRIFVLLSVILLTILYYFTSLYYVRVDADTKNLVFFHWVFGSVIDPSWIDFWQYIWQFFMAFLLFLIVPLVIIKYYFKEDQKTYGFQWGDKKFNLIWTLIGIALVPVFFFIKDPALSHEYPLTKLVIGNLALLIVFNLAYFVYYIGYEFIYRAYLQFGLKNKENLSKLGIIVIISISTIITTLFHIGKPLIEIISAAAVGLLFGYLTLRGRSFIWPVLIFHYLIGIAQNLAPLL